MMEPIGGYFPLELSFNEEYHKDAIKLNTGRNCLEYILRARKYNKVLLPYYTCSVILEPFAKLGIPYEFYHIDINLEIKRHFSLNQGEALLYTNYFGLKQQYVKQLVKEYGSRLIIDNTQAFYAEPIKGVDTFYTCRKFFGVPDGAYLYTTVVLDTVFEQDQSFDRMMHLLKRIDISPEAGFFDFRKADDGLGNQPIRRMSKLTRCLMKSIDYNRVALLRRENFKQIHTILAKTNRINLPLEDNAIPMVYPYLSFNMGLREKLIEKRIYVARYWPNVLDWCNNDEMENILAYQMLPIPIDQRYKEEEMNTIINIIQEL